MNNFIEQIIDEAFKSKAQQGLFYAKAKKSKKFKKMAKEFSDKTNWKKKLPYKVKKQANEITTDPLEVQTNVCEKKEKIQKPSSHDKGDTKVYPTRPTPWSKSVKKPKKKDVDEVVDDEGNFISGDEPGNPNAFITSKSTTDQASKMVSGQMGSYGVGFGGQTGGNKTLKYWAEADMSKGLGNEIKNDSNMSAKDAAEYFEDELEVTDEEEAIERAKEQGHDDTLPKGMMRIVENPRKYIEEYLAQRSKSNELVPKMGIITPKKQLNPITTRQLKTLKQTLKDNGLTVKDITEYLEDNE